MARKTKEEASRTRQQIIDAARQVFLERGVSRTTLEKIAQAAGVTRGAVYWHFANKAELFFAMKEQVSLPLIDRTDSFLLADDIADPLDGIERSLLEFFSILDQCPDVRQTFDIMILRCEYVDEFAPVLEEINKPHIDFAGKLEEAYRRAASKGTLRPGLVPADMALDTWVFTLGLVRQWLSSAPCECLRQKVPAIIAAHVALRRAS
jgi:TetR/AcrR family transcriptional regulator, acrAB operon repressor